MCIRDRGQHLERQLLFESAKPGQKVLIAVKLLATQLGKSINGAELTIDPTAARPDPDDLRTELLSAAEILPAITKDQTELGTQEEVLESTVEAIDIAALDTNNQACLLYTSHDAPSHRTRGDFTSWTTV